MKAGGYYSKRIAKQKVYNFVYFIIVIFYLLRPTLPYLEYFIFKDYISKNLCLNKDIPDNCCDGKCYLDEQIKKNSEPIDANRNNNKIFQDKKVDDHLLAEAKARKPEVVKILQKRFSPDIAAESFSSPVFVPPKLRLIS